MLLIISGDEAVKRLMTFMKGFNSSQWLIDEVSILDGQSKNFMTCNKKWRSSMSTVNHLKIDSTPNVSTSQLEQLLQRIRMNNFWGFKKLSLRLRLKNPNQSQMPSRRDEVRYRKLTSRKAFHFLLLEDDVERSRGKKGQIGYLCRVQTRPPSAMRICFL